MFCSSGRIVATSRQPEVSEKGTKRHMLWTYATLQAALFKMCYLRAQPWLRGRAQVPCCTCWLHLSPLAGLSRAQQPQLWTVPWSWFFVVSFFFLVFLGLHLWHMEVPRLGVESELQLPAYSTAIAIRDLSCVCDLHHSP